jgi:hypothetical protein
LERILPDPTFPVMDSLTYQIGLLNYKTSLITAWASFIGSFIWPIAIFGIVFLFRNQLRDLIPRVLEASIFGQSVKLEAKAIVVKKIQDLATEAEIQKEEVQEIEVQLSQPNTLDPIEKEQLLKQVSESNAQVRLLEIEKFRLEGMIKEITTSHITIPKSRGVMLTSDLNPFRYRDLVTLVNYIGVDEILSADYVTLVQKIGAAVKLSFIPNNKLPLSISRTTKLQELGLLDSNFSPTVNGITILRKLASQVKSDMKNNDLAN